MFIVALAGNYPESRARRLKRRIKLFVAADLLPAVKEFHVPRYRDGMWLDLLQGVGAMGPTRRRPQCALLHASYLP
jgi:hypothetical protein